MKEYSNLIFGIVLWMFLILVYCEPDIATRTVRTKYGALQGVIKTLGRHLKPVEAFFGVPYATPPIGPYRFTPTRAPSPWNGIKIFNKLSPVCPQRFPDISNETKALESMPKPRLEYLKRIFTFLTNQSEDCLYMNIFAPIQDTSGEYEAKYPILLFLHGESYEWNSGNPYDGRVLASYADIVVITLNYRLGPLGFLNTNHDPREKATVANYGLMDQIAALHWIKQNVGYFGGDPSNITLMGHGTGAACINFLMISPAVSSDLFHRTILLSGSALSTWALVEEPSTYSIELAKELNCTTAEEGFQNHDKVISCLRKVPFQMIMNTKIEAPTFLNAFGPSIDGVMIKTNYQEELLMNILPELQGYTSSSSSNVKSPIKTRDTRLLFGNKRYDMLLGIVTSESLHWFSSNDVLNGFENDRRDKIIKTYVRNSYNHHLSEIFFTIINEYTDWERTAFHPINMRDSTISALSDARFVAPVIQTADVLSKQQSKSSTPSLSSQSQNTKSFFFVFDYQTKDGEYPQRMGTAHGEELPYIFGAPLVDSLNHFTRNYTKAEIGLSESFVIYIGNFIRSGDTNGFSTQESVLPVSKERNRFKGIVWEEYDAVHQKYMEISMKPRLKNHFRAHHLSVWLRLIPELHRAGTEGSEMDNFLFGSDEYEGQVRPEWMFIGREYQGKELYLKLYNNSKGLTESITTDPLTTCFSNDLNNVSPSTKTNLTKDLTTQNTSHEYPQYTTALSITIAIGCTLLILNILIFAGVYYQRDKTRLQIQALQDQQQKQLYQNQNGSPFDNKKGFETVTIDIEPDVTAMLATNSAATLPRNYPIQSSHHHNCASSGMVTLPRHLMNSKSQQHIIRNDHELQEFENRQINIPNGSAIMVPKCPSRNPAESQPLLKSNLHMATSMSTCPRSKSGILKVPAAAISEMRV